ncbi:MAG: LysR family transcriptional regulator [Beijerinckiaceae bacterium]|nr:LysR family transcriptional regulator [Beijerinckiaceae bacterium]
MRQDQLEGLVAFVCVAENSSFSAAAIQLGVSPSAVSQSIRNLEARLGIPLFNRTTRSVRLTEAGAQYLDRIGPTLRELLVASEDVGLAESEASGLLRLNVPRAGFMILLQPVLRRFLDHYPKIKVEIALNNQLVDIVSGGFDAGLRFSDKVEKDMIAVNVGPPIWAHIVASPDYLDRRGVPETPHDLLGHDCINFRHVTSGQIEKWEFARDGEAFELAVSGRLTVNDSAALVQSALDGIGVAYMISGYIERFIENGRLVRMLPEWSPRFDGLTLYFPSRQRVPSKLRALIDFLRTGDQPDQPDVDGALL